MLEIGEQLRLHADWFEHQMPTIVVPTDVPRLAGSFEAVEEALLRSPEGPVAAGDAIPAASGDIQRPDRRPRASRHVWSALAAAAVLAVVVAGVAVMRSRTVRPAPTKPTAPVSGLIATGHDSVLLPRSTPSGLLAGEVTTGSPAVAFLPGLDRTAAPTTQLFGADSTPELELTIQPDPTPVDQIAGTAETVRGTSGRLVPAGQPVIIRSRNGASYLYGWDTIDDRYTWYEDGAYITANFKNVTAPQALDAIDGLQWVSADASAGFVAASGSGLTTLLAPTSARSSGLGLEADIDYVVEPADATSVKLVTCPGGVGDCPNISVDYATARLNGVEAADGSVTLSVDGRTNSNGDSTPGTYLQSWPDGAAVQVDFGDAQPVDPDLAKRMTAGVELSDQSGLDQLKQDISAGLDALPVLAAAELPGGRVEVHGSGLLSVTCMTPVGATPTCGSGAVLTHGPPTGGITVSAIVDGHWIVAASSTTAGTLAFASGDTLAFDKPAGPDLHADTTAVTVGATTYQLGLVDVPDGVTGIMLTQSSTPGNIGGGSIERPSS